jgi:aminoglycoside phosphotransferase (APT) family kinase protein|tara:strand:+ start:43 stop:1056 length:1014 start_codon:yes stop_codon:yes gene_type:complete
LITTDRVKIAAAEYLGEKWGTPVTVCNVEKIFGGASRETYKLTLEVVGETRGVILRRDPPSSLIDTERHLEYGAYDRIYPTDIPVPEPLFLENNTDFLEQPFSIMAAVENPMSDVALLSEEQKKIVGEQKYNLLGRLAAKDPFALKFDEIMTVPDAVSTAAVQLTYWQGVINDDEIHPQPIAQAAIRWLAANLPPPAQKISIVHGDYRTGNFLFNEHAEITAILDWEMCHLGDPLEDLAWSLDPLWSGEDLELAGKLIPHGQAIQTWCEASGLSCNEEAFKWWRIFASVKAVAIWISSSENFEKGEGKDSILAMAGWVMTDRQNRILLNYFAPEVIS